MVKLVAPIAIEDQMRFAIRPAPSVALAKEGGWQDRRRRRRNEDSRIIPSPRNHTENPP